MNDPIGRQTLLFIIGPPAVGKMTVGGQIAQLTGLKLFHNHLAIEPVLRFFPFGTPPFGRIVAEFRRRIFEEVAASELPGLIFTYVWAFELPEDEQVLHEYARPFRDRGARILYLELQASQQERLLRNSGESRLAEKPSKRDLEWSRQNLLSMDGQHRLDSHNQFEGRSDWLRIDTTELAAPAVADIAVAHFGLPQHQDAKQ